MKKRYDYADFVLSKTKDPVVLCNEMTPRKADLQHACLGIAGEAGELVDEIKKYTIYNRDGPLDKIIKEMGDLEFYLQMLRNTLGIKRSDVISANVIKLTERYEAGYSDQEAISRTDVDQGAPDAKVRG